jgi:hypothetical protein
MVLDTLIKAVSSGQSRSGSRVSRTTPTASKLGLLVPFLTAVPHFGAKHLFLPDPSPHGSCQPGNERTAS